MPVYIEGTPVGIRKGEWAKQPGATPTPYAVLQFAEKSEKPGDDSIKFIEVSLPEGDDGSTYKVGQTVKLPVRITAKDRKIYYRAEAQAETAAQPAGPRANAKS